MSDELGETYDVVVIGGGAAGLNAALMLARSRRSVVVIDAGAPRNAPAAAMHGMLGHDGRAPAELLARGREEVRGYGGRIVAGEVATVRQDPRAVGAGFAVVLADGRTTHARRVLVATGLVDVLPDLPGLRERWGRDVLHCPYCHGWEVRDQAIGVLATSPMSVHQALLFSQLSDDVTLLAHGAELDPAQREQLAARGIALVEGSVVAVETTDDRLTGVRLADGSVVAREALVVGTRMEARADFLADLGLHPVEHASGMGQHLVADATGRSEVPGVWLAGNVTDLSAQVGGAAAAGAFAAAQLNHDLVTEDTQRAVAARETARMQHAHPDDAAAFWEEFYGAGRKPWTGRPNQLLVDEVAALDVVPGRALDLGSGSGADAIWLARQGWQVTGADIARAALTAAETEAEAAGMGGRIEWRQTDLEHDFPDGSWDLVVASYLHSPAAFDRDAVLRRAAAAVAPGGTLLIIGHAGAPSWIEDPPAVEFPTTDDVLAALDLDHWHIERAAQVAVAMTSPDGAPANRPDTVVRLRRAA